MKSSEEQFREVLKRSDKLKNEYKLKKRIVCDAALTVICAVLMVFVSVNRPTQGDINSFMSERNYGSLVLFQNMSLVIIGVLAFALGIVVTLLSIHIRDYKRGKDK